MYFVPQKGRVYRWAVHTKPIYRYLLTCAIGTFLFGFYFLFLQPWMNSLIIFQQAAIKRSEQQKADAVILEHTLKQFVEKAADLHKQNIQTSSKFPEQDQLFFVFDAAEKAGVSISSFAQSREKKKEWRQKSYKSLQAQGSYEQCAKFLATLSKDSHLTQCKKLALQRADQNQFTLQCEVECINPQLVL